VTAWLPSPITVGVYVTEQLPLVSSVQLALEKSPAPSLDQVTLPVGVLPVPPAVSVTVAVQVVESPTATVAGVQLTVVRVERMASKTVTVSLPELVRWVASPP
jgi:hypothetical protein